LLPPESLNYFLNWEKYPESASLMQFALYLDVPIIGFNYFLAIESPSPVPVIARVSLLLTR
jgi:hypothetical protein